MPHDTDPVRLDGDKLGSEVRSTSGFQQRVLGCVFSSEAMCEAVLSWVT